METFSFVVPLEYLPNAKPPQATKWLRADGTTTTVEAEAVRFTFRMLATMPDELKIELRLDDVSGGIDNVVDLAQGIEFTRARLTVKYEAAIWPSGRPQALTADEAKIQQELLDKAFQADDSTEVRALKRMQRLQSVQRTCAEWPILIVDAPEGWKELDKRPLQPGVAEAIIEAYTATKYAEHVARGK